MQKIEAADETGDTKKIYAGVKALSGSNTNFSMTTPTERQQEESAQSRASEEHRREEKVTDNKKTETRASGHRRAVTENEPETRASGKRINGPRELAGIWHEFLQRKFTATELEKALAEFEALSESEESGDIYNMGRIL